MRSTASIALLAAIAYALPETYITKRQHGSLKASHVAKGMVKRQSHATVETNVFDILAYTPGGAYFANITVGTPPQDQIVQVDTGSSDLYFDASTADACESTGPNSCRGGTFNSKNSNTYKVVYESPAFNTSFSDGSTAVGPFAKDTIGMGDLRIENVQFGVADQVISTVGLTIGLMGLGYSYNEASHHIYPNMPEVLRDTGVINSRLYSIYLNDIDEVSGSILFGGIDTSKFTGEMATLNILPDLRYGNIFQFVSTVTAASAVIAGKQTSFWSGVSNDEAAYSRGDTALPVLLDSGSSAWSVPRDYYEEFFAPNFRFVDHEGLCSCRYRDDHTSLTLEFGGKVNITIPAREFIVPTYNATTNEPYPYGSGNDEECIFMIVPADSTSEGFLTLGDSILRSMYVVFDLDNGQLSIAQAAVNNTQSSNIVTVPAGPSGIATALGNQASYIGAPPQSYHILPAVSAANATASFQVSTAQSTIGTATGTAAVPNDAQVSDYVSTGSGSGSGSGSSTGPSHSSSPSRGAAGFAVSGMDWTGVYVTGMAVFLAALGAGFML